MRVVVVLDECTDGTQQVIAAGRYSGVDFEVRSVAMRRSGAVRAYGFRGAPRGPGSWCATTEGDSAVPRGWLADQLDSARNHDLFVGTVEVVDWTPRRASLRRAYADRYTPAAGHRHIHGTSLGVSAETYWFAHGFADLDAHEDEALDDACLALGARIDWSAAPPVVTSARHSNRTPTGFSAYLTDLESELPA